MSSAEGDPSPLRLTRSPRLDNALRLGWESFSRTLAAAGPRRPHAGWRRESAIRTWPKSPSRSWRRHSVTIRTKPRMRSSAWPSWPKRPRTTSWPTRSGRACSAWPGGSADGDLMAEATRRLATLAERYGDPLAAAEFFIEFLNWRREPGHSSDPEDVEVAFDEIVRLANADGAQKAAAQYAYRQVGFTSLLDADDPRAVEGDWETDSFPYQSWAESSEMRPRCFRAVAGHGTMLDTNHANNVEYKVNVTRRSTNHPRTSRRKRGHTRNVDPGRHHHAASLAPRGRAASTQSLLQLVRMLARSPVASNNITVYNDLLRLEEHLQSAAAHYHERMKRKSRNRFRRRKSLQAAQRARKEQSGS